MFAHKTQWLRKMAPPADPYLHNDLHVREAPVGWPGGHAEWVKQEPMNAHSHLLSIMIGNTISVPVSNGKLCLGTWQVGNDQGTSNLRSLLGFRFV